MAGDRSSRARKGVYEDAPEGFGDKKDVVVVVVAGVGGGASVRVSCVVEVKV